MMRLLPEYKRANLAGDLTAGLTVGVMLIPQGMAYALIAGLPPIYGLYASLVPLVIYALLGTSRQLAVGPVAMVSLLVAAGVGPLAGQDVSLYVGLSLLLALMVGVIQLVLGLARFGFLTNFLSHPVLSGFTAAAALIIGLNQLKHLLGVEIGRSNYIHEILVGAAQQASAIAPITLGIGAGSIALLVLLKRWKKAFPGALVVVVLSILAVGGLDLSAGGVAIVGTVPGGLPHLAWPPVTLAHLQALLPTALAIALVGFMESIAVAKRFALQHRYPLDANRELVALGMANIVGSLFQSYPVTGGFSRSAVNDQAGARTTLASVISAGVIALTLLFLTPLFYHMPKAVLAAIVMVAVVGLIDFREMRFLWRVKRQDFLLMLLTFVATLVLGIEEGILVGVVASLVLVIQQTSRPHVAFMGRLPGTETYRNLARNPGAVQPEGVVIMRMDAALYFANTDYFRAQVQTVLAEHPDVHALVLDMYPVNRLDATAAHALHDVLLQCGEAGVMLYMAGIKGPVRDVLLKAGVVDALGADRLFMEIHEAVRHAQGEMGQDERPAVSRKDDQAKAPTRPPPRKTTPSPRLGEE